LHKATRLSTLQNFIAHHFGVNSMLDEFEADCVAGAFRWLPLSPAVVARLISVYRALPRQGVLRAADGIHLACAVEAGFLEQAYGRQGDVPHIDNCIQRVKTGTRPNADFEHGHPSVLLGRLANIAWRWSRCSRSPPAASLKTSLPRGLKANCAPIPRRSKGGKRDR
jgi:hypothetical protein